MESELLRPHSYHTPQRDEYRHHVRHYKHFLGADLPIPLYVPKAKSAHCGGDSLREAEVRILQEREAEFVILADRNQCAGCIEAVCKQEE